MGLFSTTGTTTSGSTTTTNTAISAVGTLLPQTTAKLSSTVGDAAQSATNSAGTVLSSVTGTVGSAVSSVKSTASSVVSASEKKVSSLLSPVVTGATSELASFTSVFSKEATSLANGISSFFSGAFSDTTTAATTTLKTQVNDPVTSILKTKNPSTSGYKFTTGSGVPTEIALNGTKTIANGTSALTSTQTQTLQNRFNLDDLSGLSSSLLKSDKAAGVSSVYTDLFSTVSSTAKSATTGLSKVVSSVTSVPSQALSGLTGMVDGVTSDTIAPFVSSGTGATYASIDDPTKTIYTKDSTTTASDVNKLTSTAKNTLGCNTVGSVQSVDVSTTVSNVLLNLASQSGYTELVSAFLQCQSFVNSKSDSTLTKIVSLLGGSHPATSSVLIGAMSAPSTLNQQSYTSSVLTDSTLTSADTADLTKIFEQIGADPKDTYTTESAGGTTVPTYDLSLAAKTQTPVLNSVFGTGITGNSLLTDFLNSTPTTTTSNGTLSI